MSVRTARPEDLEAVMDLEDSCFGAGERWSRRSWADDLAAGDRHVLVIEEDEGDERAAGRPAGAATFHLVVDLCDLDRIMVRPDRRGRGLGGELLARGLDWARTHGADRVLLEVREDNPSARHLYESAGFTVWSRRAGYYGAGVDALVMGLDLTTTPSEENHV
ncbi:GNAT family N-acetyltransferase [Acidipropionibacterium timonense]|uniref:GNAT family N-acetyltransferase n=1 Tax=Acidipropionibacterium timonense TaxID=2161818 RepID=UPI001030D8DD|nr:N-acetyltransferase [Acidipropionibacterium timonense]